MASDDLLADAIGEYVHGIMGDGSRNTPTVRYYLATWASAEASDSNLSQVVLQGGTWCRYVPKLSHVTGLSAGQTIVMISSPTVPLHIVGVLVGNIKNAAYNLGDSTPPSVPSGLTVMGGATLTSIPLMWTASTDNIAVTAYDVFVDGDYNQSVISNVVTVGNLQPGTSYTFTVRARDAAGNVSAPSSGLAAATLTPSAPPAGSTTVQKYYPAVWSRTFNRSGGNEWNSHYGNNAYQGQNEAGNLKSQIGFDWATIAADLTGATEYVGARVRLTYAHWWMNSGGTAVIGTHSNASPPGSFSAASTGRWSSGGWPRGGTRWVALGAGVCGEFAAGSSKGICLGPGSSSSVTYYGYAYGAGSGVYVPTLELTWKK